MDYFDILLAKKLNGGGGGDITIEDLYVNENGTVIAPSGKAYGKVVTNVPAPSNALFKQTLSGLPSPIATFTGADAPIDSLKASIVGVQDLHGYDKPWVGGAGKNKLPLTIDVLKTNNTSGTWTGNTYVKSNATFKVVTDNDGNVTGIELTSTATSTDATLDVPLTLPSGSYILSNSYAETFGAVDTFLINSQNTVIARGNSQSPGSDFTLNESENLVLRIRNNGSSSTVKTFKPMIRLSTVTDSTFAPYSNICPISGWSSAIITNKDDLTAPTITKTVTISFGQDVYGGVLNVSTGVLTVTDAYIASYNGETLPSIWISDRDVYASGTTPTTGAEVVYKLATPTTIQLTPTQVRTIQGNNNVSADCGEVTELKYFSDTP